MSRVVIGAIAHVDAGKTTLSEAVLHKTGVLKSAGRVDHEDSFLDYHTYEKDKGITVYAKEARFSHGGKDFVYVDTPGHLDFYGEVERVLSVLDAAVLIIDSSSLIPSDTIRKYLTLRDLRIPVFLFLNKTDISHRSKDEVLKELREKLDPSCIPYESLNEEIALNDEELLEDYLVSGSIPEEAVSKAIQDAEYSPVFFGSALKEEGVEELLDALSRHLEVKDTSHEEFKAYVYKIDEYVHLKVFSGILRNKDSFGDLKVNELFINNGIRKESVHEVKGSDLCLVKGLTGVKAGTWLPSLYQEASLSAKALTYIVSSPLDDRELFQRISILNEELPELHISLGGHVTMQLNGELQKEFIERTIEERFGIRASFSDPLIRYRESIDEEVYGVGHYEPLRHYAEVLVKLRPAEDYRLKVSRENAVLADYLRTYIPRGILTNSPLDQIEIEIAAVRTHLKHTEGQDVIKALRRAIRHALTKTSSHLLEPYYLLLLSGPDENTSIMNECAYRRYHFDVEDNGILAKVPLLEYNSFITSLKMKYRDTLNYEIISSLYDRCHNEEEVLSLSDYDYTEDTRDPAGSIFTRNGAGTYVPPEEVEENMHIPLSEYIDIVRTAGPVHRPRVIKEEELKRVWDSLYKPRPRYIERKRESEDGRTIDLSPSKPLLYLIDGYNLMHSMEDMPLDDLLTAREKVNDAVADFSGYVNAECVLVYDAYLTQSTRESFSKHGPVSVVYTKKGHTADMYIERKSKELEKDYKVIVVTSDALEQLSIFSSNAARLSSREFLARYRNFQKNMKHLEKASYTPLSSLKELLEEE